MLSTLLLWLQPQPCPCPEDSYVAVHGSLYAQFGELIAFPIVVTLILYMVKWMSAATKPTWDEAFDLAIETATVGTVACSSLFANDTIHKNWGEWAEITGHTVTFLCVGVIVGLGLLRRWVFVPPMSKKQAGQAMWIGLIPLFMDLILLVVGYFFSMK
jgi:hypothetical protein